MGILEVNFKELRDKSLLDIQMHLSVRVPRILFKNKA